MRKTRFLCMYFILLGISAIAQTTAQWSIHGNIEKEEELPNSISLAAFSFPSESFEPLAKIKIEPNGQFQWSGPFKTANIYQLKIGEQAIRLAVDTTEAIEITFSRGADQWQPKIKGSSGTAKMYQFPAKLREREAFYFGDLKQEMETAMNNKDEATLAKIQEQVGQLFPRFVADLQSLLQDLGSSTAVYGALDYIDPNKGQAMIEQTILRMQAEKPHIPVTKSLVERLAKMKGIPIGAVAPPFSGQSMDGSTVSLGDYTGKYLYIDFWASWCLACRAENPKLVALFNTYKSAQFDMLGIGIKDKEASWKAAIAKDGLPWTQLNDTDNGIGSAYFVMSLPQNVFLDPAGKILYRNIGSEELAEVLKGLFK
ncbi:MAG: TlpA family protein disulfide reductase [Saprospiraceae bacterium]|nr:TlpA family protein disulfide reductase [Saprospiraceae bacterium]